MSYPSIFNDVLGPVMRGPSSSHCAASLRIGRICRNLMNSYIETVHITYDPEGSLATTHKGQGSDMGLFGGLLGWEASDERLADYDKHIKESGMEVIIEIAELENKHPNAYDIVLSNNLETHHILALSIGGGMIEIIEIDHKAVSFDGGFYETIIFSEKFKLIDAFLNKTEQNLTVKTCEGHPSFLEIKSSECLEDSIYRQIQLIDSTAVIREIKPVLPVLSRANLKVPFITVEDMLRYNEDKNLELWELALHYEAARGNISHDEVFKKMENIADVMKNSIKSGLEGTQYDDRILGVQSKGFKDKLDSNKLLKSDLLNQIILYVTAIMENKSAMGVIVAAPTAGSCGAMPGTVWAVSDFLEKPKEETLKAMLISGLIGVFIAEHASFAAEVGGCQAECGSGSGMAAAAISYLAGGNIEQSLAAASFALQNSFGMVCDPIANRVEAPCLGKNIMASSNALSSANIALANYDHLIPLDQVINVMKDVGENIAHELRCTGKGGLAITEAAKKIEAELRARNGEEMLTETVGRFKIC